MPTTASSSDRRLCARVASLDALDALAVIHVVLAQPSISSQLVDNLNASSHLRALLTDLFLIGEILRTPAKSMLARTDRE